MDPANLVDFLPFTTVGTFHISRVRLSGHSLRLESHELRIFCVVGKNRVSHLPQALSQPGRRCVCTEPAGVRIYLGGCPIQSRISVRRSSTDMKDTLVQPTQMSTFQTASSHRQPIRLQPHPPSTTSVLNLIRLEPYPS